MSQTKDQYFYATVYYQECALYGFNQQKFTTGHNYYCFNNYVNVGEYIYKTRQRRVLIKDTAQKIFNFFDDISSDEKSEVIKDTKERYLS